MRHCGHGTVRPVAAHDAVKEWRPRPPTRTTPRTKSWSSTSAADVFSIIEPIRTRNIEIVVLKSVVVVIVVIVVLIIVFLMLDHKRHTVQIGYMVHSFVQKKMDHKSD